MIHVKVSYTVAPGFAAKNQENIQAFLKDFQQMEASSFHYEVFTLADGNTFLHLSAYRDEMIQHQILNVPSFVAFQKQRDESGLIISPIVEILHLIGDSKS